ncbi:DUF1828 domain-containing protein [Lactiplantibacillus plantarum]|uniref:DUF1828 domain-containing protein n=1 Tax=Lactiplantibacillus plantarum TaxID=1590 RepID=UPI000CF8F8C7|nr:DUF1828 domain-containing protein [Lactiplantibacillus plantarum]MCG0641009.1 hypothetical protein [Lactiplantibacillus plantarum]MCG0866625.1 hypothetical protein [Lactiplantibacillus plantarum]MDN5975985.1 DUF1828 domain-containing protein [Lactiplantibacillus plantarum]MDN5992507.1 DUF1828 domain-containing protein [Lactiplantibacillus plantarum]MDN6016268.1 DUF1828 domain-containing protein [Lactiplantibacillus plantarum]
MLSGKTLSEQYYKWIRENTSFKEIGSKIIRIDEPFLDNDSDEITMYVIQNNDNSITLTDDGWTIDNLEGKGVSITRSTKRKKILNQQIKAYGVSYNEDELYITTTLDKFPESKHRLLQAILFVNDMFMLAPKNVNNIFLEDVSAFFSAHKIRTSKNMAYIGASGLTHKYDFSIPGIDNIPMKLIKTLASPNNPMFAKSILADVEQTKPVLEDQGDFYVFLNDCNANKDSTVSVNPDIMRLFKGNGIKPVLYSERENYVEELSR